MKKMLIVMFVVSMAKVGFAVQPYINGEIGGVTGAIHGHSEGVRVGVLKGNWDGSLGYMRISGSLDSDKTWSNDIAVNAIGAELYRHFNYTEKLSFLLGGGFGYGMPELSGIDKPEGDLYTSIGGEARYALSPILSLGFYVKGFFMNTDVRRFWYGSHNEILSNGQGVEVLDEYHSADSLNLNSARIGLSLTYLF